MQFEATVVLPAVNAALNGTSAVLLFTGRHLVKRRQIEAHRKTMIAAVISSALFLVSYLGYHTLRHIQGISATKHFAGSGIWRTIYFTILGSHTVLAAIIVPLALITLVRGLRRQDARHRAIARVTFPLWMYVSVTGVVIYFMLYQWF